MLSLRASSIFSLFTTIWQSPWKWGLQFQLDLLWFLWIALVRWDKFLFLSSWCVPFLKIDLIVSPLTLRKVKESYFLLSVASKKMFFKFSSIASSFKLQSSVTSSASASINQLTNYKLIWFKIRKKKIQKKPTLIALPFILFDDFPPPDWLGHTFSLSSLSLFFESFTVSELYAFLSDVSRWFLMCRK